MSRNSDLIQRVKRISLELPILKGEFDKTVDVAKKVADVEPAFNAMSDTALSNASAADHPQPLGGESGLQV